MTDASHVTVTAQVCTDFLGAANNADWTIAAPDVETSPSTKVGESLRYRSV
jgi:hypothetical protein